MVWPKQTVNLNLQDKEASIPHEELGRSLATVQELQRKHEIFDRELTALGNKVCPQAPATVYIAMHTLEIVQGGAVFSHTN
jgi:hypothetical protein